jgi:hypothetical protein
MAQMLYQAFSDKSMWDVWLSMWRLAATTVAHEIGFFKALQGQSLTTEKLSSQLSISQRAVEALAGVLAGDGFLIKRANILTLSPAAETYLLAGSSFYWGAQLVGLRQRQEHERVLAAVKSSEPKLYFDSNSLSQMWKEGTITSEAAHNFTEKMQATISAPSFIATNTDSFKSIKNLLDMGAGSACFSIAFAERYLDAKVTVFDLPPVCEVAKEYINKSAVAKRITIQPGNFFKDKWPNGHDGILFSQILHDWPLEVCKHLIEMAYQSLEDGGQIVIHEMLLNKNRTKPLTTACFDLLMFINHGSQQFAKNEIFDLLRSAGFKRPQSKKGLGYYSIISAEK